MKLGESISGFVSGLVSPVADVFTQREKRKQAAKEIDGAIALAQQKGETTITVNEQQWEAISANKSDTTWKDEYVTVICTLPYVLITLGCLLIAFGQEPAMLDGALDAIAKLKAIGIDAGHLCEVVVYAAVSLKVWRGRG